VLLFLKSEETKLTRKHQTTVPKDVRKFLGVGPGEAIRWRVVRGVVVVDAHKKMHDPVGFLTSQVHLDVDAVRLVRETREPTSSF
jgi:bifunctional DNA-binding transcriptional regulator/antitoxin component of YhaV-PrlF toxin-antitoxin module